MDAEPVRLVGRRVAALIVDLLLTAVVVFAIFLAFGSTRADVGRSLQAGDVGPDTTLYGIFLSDDTGYSVHGGTGSLVALLVLLVWLGYWVVLPGTKGFTLGKAALGLRVVKDDGTLPPGIPRTLARQLLVGVDAFPYVIPYLTGFLVARRSDRNQRVGDLFAGTLVVRREAVEP